jgi:D-alanyl-D-alanine carboxypeptidase
MNGGTKETGDLDRHDRSVAAGKTKWYPCDMKKSKWFWILAAVAVTLIVVLGSVWIFFTFGGPDRWPIFAKKGTEWVRVEYAPEELSAFSIDDGDLEERGIVVNESLFLINNERPVPEDRAFSIGNYKETDVPMNRAMHEDYSRLSAAVKAETDDNMYVMSSYRSFDDQHVLFEEDPTIAAEPGRSEHHSGLALDVYVFEYAGAGFLKSDAGKFVNEHCHEYGFIIRYPKGKEDVTGFPYEPWHIRYVGQPHARYITLNHLTLEEYIERLEPGGFYRYDGYVVSRQTGPDLLVPECASEITVSEDNTGYYVITFRSE